MNLGWIPSMGMYLMGIFIIACTFKQFLRKTVPSTKANLETLLKNIMKHILKLKHI